LERPKGDKHRQEDLWRWREHNANDRGDLDHIDGVSVTPAFDPKFEGVNTKDR
jgi:hypothetical protein